MSKTIQKSPDPDVLPSELFNDIDLILESRKKSNEFRKIGKLTDLTLKTNDGSEFQVHKNILATTCRFFCSMLDSESNWKEKDSKVIQLKEGVSKESVEAILSYLYTGQVEINSANAYILLEGAVFFNLPSLKKIVTKFPIKNIQKDTVLDLWRYAGRFFNDELEDKCLEFIAGNCAEFLEKNLNDLKPDEMKKIAALKKIKLTQENLYSNIATWIKDDFDNRQNHLKALISKIKFDSISDEFKTEKILCDPILCQNRDFLEMMVKQFHESLSRNDSKNKCNTLIAFTEDFVFRLNIAQKEKQFSPILKHTKADSTYIIHPFSNEKYLLVGFMDNKVDFECYCPETNAFKNFPAFPSVNRKLCGVTSFQDRIYVAGGTGLNTTEILDLKYGLWIQGPVMSDIRSNFSLVATNKNVYAFGGLKPDNATLHDTIECFDPKTNKWEIKLTSADCSFNFCHAVHHNNIIYCFSNTGGKIYNIDSNSFTGDIPKPPNTWTKNKFEIAKNCDDDFCYVFGIENKDNVDQLAGYKYSLTESKWENLDIEFPSQVKGELKLCSLNVPPTFGKLKLFDWISA